MPLNKIRRDLKRGIRRARYRVGESIAGRADLQRHYNRKVVATKSVRAFEALDDTLDQLRHDLDRHQEFGGPRSRRISNLHTLQKELWHLWHIDPTTRNAIMLLTALTVGNGISIDFGEQVRTDGVRAQDAWDEFDAKVKYSCRCGRYWKATLNQFLFGEWFHWFKSIDLQDVIEGELAGLTRELDPTADNFPTDMRGLDPITSPGGVFDVKTLRGDIETKLAYVRSGAIPNKVLYPPEVTVWLTSMAGNDDRGRPILEAAIDDIYRLRQSKVTTWMFKEWRRRMLTIIYKITDPDLADDLPDTLPVPEPLTALEVPAGAEVDFPDSSKMTDEGGRYDTDSIRGPMGGVAQATQLPIHLLALDFREGTLAGLESATGPLGRIADMWAGRVQGFIESDALKVAGTKQRNGKPMEVNATVHPVVIRDPWDERDSWLGMWLEGALSLESLHEKTDIDHDAELERMVNERAARMAGEPINPNEAEFGNNGDGELEELDDSGDRFTPRAAAIGSPGVRADGAPLR